MNKHIFFNREKIRVTGDFFSVENIETKSKRNYSFILIFPRYGNVIDI